MSGSAAAYRLDGIYRQRQDGYFMQRVKLAAGVIAARQAEVVAAVASTYGQGVVHLTTRGSMEIHWLRESDLPAVKRELAMVGLTSRGACGGAVRGVTCGNHGAQGFPLLEGLARRLQRHFTANPRFEGLPKKFKVGIEADVASGRHLIQDVGLVLAEETPAGACYDVWIAGGLGREPQAGFLLAAALPEERLIPVVEAVIRVYARHAPPPKRLKFLAREFGEERLRELIAAEPGFDESLPPAAGFPEALTLDGQSGELLRVTVPAGQLTAGQLTALATLAGSHAGGLLQVTSDQDVVLPLLPGSDRVALGRAVAAQTGLAVDEGVRLRVCPGSHECLVGLAPTREIAAALLEAMGPRGRELDWALSGCPNSCAQPQLAAVGIGVARLAAAVDGERTPCFDIWRRTGAGLGEKTATGITFAEVVAVVQAIG